MRLLLAAILTAPPQTVPPCRMIPAAMTSRATGAGMAQEASTTCRYDRAVNKVTCTSRVGGGRGSVQTTVSVTSYESLADVLDEVSVIPPRRRFVRTDTTTKMLQKTVTATLVNTYDARERLVKEVGSDGPGRESTTTYTAWDAAGRPTAGTSVSKGGRNTLAIAYDNGARTMTTTSTSRGGRVTCTMTFDANGNQAAGACTGVGGIKSGSTMTITATERVCR
jgi:hypothetical protein